MPFETEPLFRDDAYLRDCLALVVAVNDRGGIILNRTVFYATSGGQSAALPALTEHGTTAPAYASAPVHSS